MQKLVFGLIGIFCIGFTSFSQTKSVEKGTYLSTNKGQKIKLNLLDDNKYEMVFYSGEYELKGDSVLFKKTERLSDVFDLTYSKDKSIKSKKVKIKFIDAYYSFYLGTQSGTQDVVYQKIKIDYNTNPDQTDVTVEIERSDFIYLVYEDYDGAGSVAKYALPKDINDVAVKYAPDIMGDLNISGFYDSKTNQLTVGDKLGKNPLVFQSEKSANNAASNSKVVPLEAMVIPNWTYPGKEPLIQDDFGSEVVVDTAATDGYNVYPPLSESGAPKVDFKLKVEDNLKEAIAATQKAPNKFLVVYTDDKNPAAKTDFDTFIKDQQTVIGYSFYDVYKPELDPFNFYMTSKSDKKWLKTNKIESDPAIIILDEDGNVLATAQATLLSKSYQFNYYDPLYKSLSRANSFYDFKKVTSAKKKNDTDLIAVFNRVAGLDVPYEYETAYAEGDNLNKEEFKIDYPKFDKKEISQIWRDLIAAHQKDAKPNLYLVETILREIKNVGFTKQFFNEEKILNDTDFLAIDYVIKHAAAIDAERIQFNAIENEIHSIGSISSEISNALSQNNYLSDDDGLAKGKPDQKKVIGVYQKLIANGNGNYDSYKNYFDYLKSASATEEVNVDYLKEFDAFFTNNLSPEKGNAFELLDKLYGTGEENSLDYSGWDMIKVTCSLWCNESAWSVVVKPDNAIFLKKAINWSEFSLVINKKNPYYLDTLAQLYYKDDQKERAIKTQEEALKYAVTEDPESLAEMKEVLQKMQNGTY